MSWWLIGFKPIGSSSTWTFKVIQGTQAQAEAQQKLAVNGTLDGPFSTKAEAVAAEAKERTKPIPAIGLPGVKNPIGTLNGFLTALSDKNTWVRIAEAVLGLGLLIVGLSQLAKGTPLGDAAGKAAKFAMLA